MSDFVVFQDEKYDSFEFIGNNDKIAILIHGFPGTPYEMRSVGEIIQELGYTVRGLLLPGFGSDISTLHERKKEDWLNFVEYEIRNAQNDYSEVILVGYSFGAALVINAVASYEDISPSKIILIAPFWNIFAQYNWLVRMTGPLVWPLGRLISPEMKVYENIDFKDPKHREDLEETFDSIDLDDPEVQDFIRNITIPFKIIDEVYKIGRASKKKFRYLNQIPVLILQGLQDGIVPPRSTRKLISKRGQNVIYQELPEMTHEFIKPDKNNKDQIYPYITTFLGE